MARNKNRNKPQGADLAAPPEKDDAMGDDDVTKEVAHTLPDTKDAVSTAVTTVPPQPTNVIPLAPREITLEAFIRNKGALGTAFRVTERTESKSRTVKRTRAAWQKRYDVWIKAPRG